MWNMQNERNNRTTIKVTYILFLVILVGGLIAYVVKMFMQP